MSVRQLILEMIYILAQFKHYKLLTSLRINLFLCNKIVEQNYLLLFNAFFFTQNCFYLLLSLFICIYITIITIDRITIIKNVINLFLLLLLPSSFSFY